MQKFSTHALAEALSSLGGAFLVGMALGALTDQHYTESLQYLFVGSLGLWFGRGFMFPKV